MTKLLILASALLSLICACDDSRNTTENIPRGLVNLVIDLNLSSNMHLVNPGTHLYAEGGVKGVLILHDYDDNWYAFERTCAFEPTKNCSRIWVDSINLQLICGEKTPTNFTPCCQSKYMYSGFPTQGPAAGRLAQYYITRNGNILQIYN